MAEGSWQPAVRTVAASTRIGIMRGGRVAAMAGLAFINCVGLVNEFRRQPGVLTVTIAALPAVMLVFGCMTAFTIVQTDVVKIVFEPAVGIGMAGIAGTQIMV